MGVAIVNAPVVNGGRIFFSTDDNHFYALAETNGRHPLGSAGRGGIGGHSRLHQRRRLGAVRDRALYLGRALRHAGAERPAGLERPSSPIPAWSPRLSELDDIAARPVIDRDLVFAISHSGVMAAISLASGERALDARSGRHPDALGSPATMSMW